ncbi:MAG: thermonuclease family protein, partial [Methyloligellaceae bacterium]
MGEDTGFDWVTPTQMVKLAKEASRAARWSERRPILVAIFKGLMQWVAFVGLLFGIGALFVVWDNGLTRETLLALSAGSLSILIIVLSHRGVQSRLPSLQFPTVRLKLPPMPNFSWPRLNRQTFANLKRPEFKVSEINWSGMASIFRDLGRHIRSLGRALASAGRWTGNHIGSLSLSKSNWKALGSGVVALGAVLLFFGFDGWGKTTSLMSALSGIQEIKGKARVIDGQSLRISSYRVQLKDIDAPEINQRCRTSRGRSWRCGRQSAAVLKKLVG